MDENEFKIIVSIVMPAYNAEEFIREAIDSVLSQDYENFELIIANDGSTDNTSSIIKEYSDHRIRVIEHENIGLSKTLNKAISIAKGEFICRIDSDDICQAERLSTQMRLFRHGVVLVGSNVEYIDENSIRLGFSYSPLSNSSLKKKLLNGNCIFHPSVIFRKDAFYAAGGYDESINLYFEDYILWCKMAAYGDFVVSPKFLIQYRVHSNSVTSNTPAEMTKLMRVYADNGFFTDDEWKEFQTLTNTKKDKVKPVGYRIFQKSMYLCFMLSYIRTIFKV